MTPIMTTQYIRMTKSASRLFHFPLLCVLLLLAVAGCKQNAHTSDPKLQQIDEMLNSQLPPGTAKSRVIFYLSSQGFTTEASSDDHAVVAIVHHVDTDTLQPANARVTFHFDAADKLQSYELVEAAGGLR
ncbi:MAG TPA: hypothetical protein VFQ18_01650 [Candidatus Acidoferrum sp.]|nr:hypothetical protein [Candidatus Acidoferrum sp.]